MLRKTLCFWINNTRKFFQEFSITLMPEKRLNIYIRPIAMGISLSVYFLRFLSEKWSTCKLIIYIIQLTKYVVKQSCERASCLLDHVLRSVGIVANVRKRRYQCIYMYVPDMYCGYSLSQDIYAEHLDDF